MLKPGIDSLERGKKEKKEEPQELPKQEEKLKFKVRFDYKGKPKPARFFFGGKRTEEVAHEIREQQLGLWRNVPLQGIFVEHIDLGDIYFVYDDDLESEMAFAPLELVVSADSFEDMLRFIVREEFRRIEILEPTKIVLSTREAERMLFKINEILQNKLLTRKRENHR